MNDLRCPLREAAEISPKQPALIREGLTLPFAEYDQFVKATTARLQSLGFAEGDRVGIFLQNDWQYPILLLALFRMGAIACPLSTRWPKEHLKRALASISCEKLIAAIREDTQHKQMWGVDIYDPEGLVCYESPSGEVLSPKMRIDQPATILFTSGSTGLGKAVLHSYGNHYYSAAASNANIRVHSGERWLLNLPLYHVGGIGIIFRCLLGGAAVVLPSHEESLEDSLIMHQVTHLSLVPTQLYRLLKMDVPKDCIERLRAVLVGGGACPAHLVKEAREKGYPVFCTYGLTEMSSQVTTTHPESNLAQRLTSGTALRFHEVKINAEDEILVRGKTLFSGYVEENRLRRPVDDEGWFHTGDLGQMHQDGYLTVLGRKDTMFISGGENIHPERIEAALCELEQAEEAVVVPIPHEEYGYRPVAFVRTHEPGRPDEEKIRADLREKLPGFMVPDHIYPWPENGEAELKTSRAGFQERAQQLAEGID